jgi:2-C-methyl-D-erythritol 2,4-cyclodiphosphate synthase
MEEAFKRMDGRGYRIGNLDVTLILQAPKVCPRNSLHIVTWFNCSLSLAVVLGEGYQAADERKHREAIANH